MRSVVRRAAKVIAIATEATKVAGDADEDVADKVFGLIDAV